MTAEDVAEETVFDQVSFQHASLSSCTSSGPASNCTQTSLSSFGSEPAQPQPNKRRSFKRIISKLGGSKHKTNNVPAEADAQQPRRAFGLKALLRGLTFSEQEMQLLTMDKRELEAMKCFGMDRETYRTVQANELRYVRMVQRASPHHLILHRTTRTGPPCTTSSRLTPKCRPVLASSAASPSRARPATGMTRDYWSWRTRNLNTGLAGGR